MEDLDNLEMRMLHTQYLPNYNIQMHVLLKTIWKIVFKPLPYFVFQEDYEITESTMCLKRLFSPSLLQNISEIVIQFSRF